MPESIKNWQFFNFLNSDGFGCCLLSSWRRFPSGSAVWGVSARVEDKLGDSSVSTCALPPSACGGDVEERLRLPQLGPPLQVIDVGCGGLCIWACAGMGNDKTNSIKRSLWRNVRWSMVAVTDVYLFAGCCGGPWLWREEGPLCNGGGAWEPGAGCYCGDGGLMCCPEDGTSERWLSWFEAAVSERRKTLWRKNFNKTWQSNKGLISLVRSVL